MRSLRMTSRRWMMIVVVVAGFLAYGRQAWWLHALHESQLAAARENTANLARDHTNSAVFFAQVERSKLAILEDYAKDVAELKERRRQIMESVPATASGERLKMYDERIDQQKAHMERERGYLDYAVRMRTKYAFASDHPWLAIESDPLPP